MRPIIATLAFTPLLAFATLLAQPTLNAADEQPRAEKTHAQDRDVCIVCEHDMKKVTNPKTAAIGGKNCNVCSDKCSAEVTTRSEYYRGIQDGMARRDRDAGYIGPKGGDTRKSPPPAPQN